MASCKDCIQYGECEYADNIQYEDVEQLKNDCPGFKNKADFVEVVRCKDCIHKVVTDDGEFDPYDIVCDFHSSDGFDENDFCSYGEKALKERERK